MVGLLQQAMTAMADEVTVEEGVCPVVAKCLEVAFNRSLQDVHPPLNSRSFVRLNLRLIENFRQVFRLVDDKLDQRVHVLVLLGNSNTSAGLTNLGEATQMLSPRLVEGFLEAASSRQLRTKKISH